MPTKSVGLSCSKVRASTADRRTCGDNGPDSSVPSLAFILMSLPSKLSIVPRTRVSLGAGGVSAANAETEKASASAATEVFIRMEFLPNVAIDTKHCEIARVARHACATATHDTRSAKRDCHA